MITHNNVKYYPLLDVVSLVNSHNKGYYPTRSIIFRPSWATGYYISANGDIVSTKRKVFNILKKTPAGGLSISNRGELLYIGPDALWACKEMVIKMEKDLNKEVEKDTLLVKTGSVLVSMSYLYSKIISPGVYSYDDIVKIVKDDGLTQCTDLKLLSINGEVANVSIITQDIKVKIS